MNPEQRQLFKKYCDILLRHKKLILTCLVLGTAFGLAQYLRSPKIYKSEALIKYQRKTINPTVMSPDDLRTRTRDVVDTVSQQIVSRTSLEGIIKEFGIYPEMTKNIPMEDVVDIMRNNIEITFLRGGDVFTISYQGSNPEKVLSVTNILAAKFIEENLRYRQEIASQTSSYTRDELNMAKVALDKKELLMRDYKLQYYNEMPGQMQNNINRLSAMQEQYQNNQVSSVEMERTKLLVQEQISVRKLALRQYSTTTLSETTDSTSPPQDTRDIYQLRSQLISLQTRYTDKHPEIKRLKKFIRDLEMLPEEPPGEKVRQPIDPQIEELKQQLKDLKFGISSLKEAKKKLSKQIKKYEQWITAAPIREAEWSALTRNYEQLNVYYERLVTLSLQAESAQSLENQLQGSQFKIVDSAFFPEKPIKPVFLRILLIAVGGGLAIGTGLAIGIESLSSSFKNTIELETYLNMPVVCAIPAIYTKRENLKNNIQNIVLNISLTLAFIAIAGFTVYFWKQGMIIL